MRYTTVVSFSLFALLFGACANQHDSMSHRERDALAMRPYEELRQQKAELWELGFEPQEFEFEGEGKVVVSEWALSGWPGQVQVKARVRYENTTDKPVTHAIVWLEVLDSQDRVAGSSGIRLVNPLGYPLWPGHSVTSVVYAPTNDAHLDPRGWQWGVACSSYEDDDPGEKPVLVVTPDRAAAGQAPGHDTGWQRLPRRPALDRARNNTYYRRSFPYVQTNVPGVPYWEGYHTKYR